MYNFYKMILCNFKLSLLIAIRFICGPNRSSTASLNWVISTISIILGIVILIIGLSAINGFQKELNNRILSIIPHYEIESINNQPLYNWKRIISSLKKIPEVVSIAPYINFMGLIKNGIKIKSIYIQGIDPAKELDFSHLSKFINKNTWHNFQSNKNTIMLGQGVANSIDANEGDWITITINDNNDTEKLTKLKDINVQVKGIFKLGSILDQNIAIITLSDAQNYLNMHNNITGIKLKINNPFKTQNISKYINKLDNLNLIVHNWINKYGYLYNDIQMIRKIIYLVMIFVMSISCFSIISILFIVIKEKNNDIAILQTLGIKNYLIYITFMFYGLIISIPGSIIGILIGVLISLNLTYLIHKIEYIINYPLLNSKIYFIDFCPTELYFTDILYILLTVIVLSLFASCYPAHCAKLIKPVRVLNYK
ncbi:MAG: lipoprotein-releasing ABC transporter permease subunit LolE [Pantoea sp. Brub]|nr:lipoprotein-releasing ABC transporter permease subunit LolE [Pantoea sp. Brub]